MELIDLHCHTTASDGIYSPGKLIDYAKNNGVNLIAVTDHDTIDGIDEAVKYVKKIKYNIIIGIEFSIDYQGGSFHLLGLGIDYQNDELKSELHQLQIYRQERIEKIVADLNNKGYKITVEDIKDVAACNALGRPHVARALIKKGYVNSMAEAFSNFMVKGKPGYVKKKKIKFERAIELIKKSGGIPIIAHPISMGHKNWLAFENELKYYIDYGVKGIEVYSSMHSDEDIKTLLEISKRYSLIISGGSDFHGDKNEKLGYVNEIKIPVELKEQFKDIIL